MTIGHTASNLLLMTAKVTLSFSDDTIADARRYAERDGMSLSAWMDRAAKEKALRELFEAHANVMRRAGWDTLEKQALADEADFEMASAALRGRGGKAGRAA
jgi:uncharacterized protein DUF6364